MPFFLLTLAISFWELDFHFLVHAKNIEELQILRRIPRIATMLLAPLTINFVYSLINRKKDLLWYLTMVIGCIFIFFRFIFYQKELYFKSDLYWVPETNLTLIIYFLFTYILIFYAIFLIFKEYFSIKDLLQKKRLLYIGLGLFFWVFLSLDILSVVFNDLKIFFIGNIAGIIFIFFTTYALTKLDLFDKKLIISGSSVRLIDLIYEKIAHIYDKKQFFAELKTSLEQILNYQVKEIYCLNQDKKTKKRVFINEDKTCFLPENDILLNLIRNNKQIFITKNKEIIKESTLYNLTKNNLILPLFSSQMLECIMIISKNSNKDFNKSDIKTLNFLVQQVIPIVDRIKPYEQIKSEYEATKEKLYHAELEIAKIERFAAIGRITQQFHHELRTPLSIIQMSTENLPNLDILENHKKKVIKQIRRALRVIDTTMDLYKGKKPIKENININHILQETLNLISAENCQFILEFQQIPDILGVSNDLLTVFTNLISNAKKAIIKDKGEIILRTYQKDSQIITEIIDNGKGISATEINKIWEPYYTTNPEQGHGLGLSIVQSIIEYHNGKIHVESKINKGTKFTIYLPLL